MVETFIRKRVEVLIDAPLVPRLAKAAAEAGINGYTLVPAHAGLGSSGPWHEDAVSGAQTKSVFLVVASPEKASRFVELLAPHLDAYGMLLTQFDVEVLRQAKF
jgi:PII-like signaling protein